MHLFPSALALLLFVHYRVVFCVYHRDTMYMMGTGIPQTYSVTYIPLFITFHFICGHVCYLNFSNSQGKKIASCLYLLIFLSYTKYYQFYSDSLSPPQQTNNSLNIMFVWSDVVILFKVKCRD